MNNTKKQIFCSVAIASLLCIEALFSISSARADTPLAARKISPTEGSKTLPLKTNHRQSSLPFLLTSEAQPYIGKWSSGSGETLSITSNRIKFGDGKGVTYKDITKATDGNTFQINITGHGLPKGVERFMFLKIDGDKMTMTGYNSYEDMQSGQNQGSEVNWFR